jgi:hypothetical protein
MGSELELARDAGRDAQEMRIQNAQKADAAVELQRRATASATAFEENKALREDAKRRAQEAETAAKVEEVGKLAPNPEQFWQSRSGFQKAMLGLSVALGGYSAGRKGTPNQARAALDKAIADDIALQRETIGAKRANAVNVLAEMRKRFGDERQAEQASIATMQKQAARTIEVLAYQAKDADRAAQLSEIAASYHQSAAEALAKTGASQVSETQVRTKDQVVGGGGGGLANPGQVFQDLLRRGFTPEQATKEMQTAYRIPSSTAAQLRLAAGPSQDRSTEVKLRPNEMAPDPRNYVPELRGFAFAPTEAVAIRDTLQMANNVRSDIERLSELSRSGSSLSPGDRTEVESITQRLAPQVSLLTRQGMVRPGDDFLQGFIPKGASDPTLTDGQFQRRAQTALQYIDNNRASYIRNNITPGEVYKNQYGNIEGRFTAAPSDPRTKDAADAAFAPAGQK